MTHLADLSAHELARGIRRRDYSPVEVVDAVLARIEERRDLNAFVTVTGDAARAAARAAEQAVMRDEALAPLHGIPFSVKDMTWTQGMRTTYGSYIFEEFVPASDAESVARARAGGAILVGKTTTPEFAHKIHTSTPMGGLTLNPFSPDVTCGGSSGGAAVAVSAGMGPLALGTDGGGSVRIPASCCGIVGLKPTLGRIPDSEAVDAFAASAHVGPMARDVAGTRLLFEAIEGFHRDDPYGQAVPPQATERRDLKGLRVGWMRLCGNSRVEREVDRLTSRTVSQMEAMGARVEEVEVDFAGLEPYFFVFMETRMYRSLKDHIDRFRDRIDPTIIPHFENGSRHTALDYIEALSARTRAFKAVQAILERVDVIVSPTMAAPPLPHAQDPHGPVVIDGVEVGRVRHSWYPYTLGFNMTGHPAISIPCGLTEAGLPVGFQIAAGWYREELILDVAAQVESALGFEARPAGRVR